ncbi:MAG: bifunctional phosphopantothenoylcysteine decarboxylase/phosphopantothenate--cysteine ligase CoaBC [Bacteroidales bacterium]|jgi:phosphopantothenoylcysteine decarboxylase/phosphopantothenate--cysteine ligase|nr:bifunctional phosphopantothenoylcysteine decarboxylase/phosphopantothenate--cysteine ligase CoaBC [Bacteroidales bacterium]
MSSLKGKHILLGVTGSIAAYKAALLVRLLVKEGAEVKVIMTEMAKQFITPLTMATLSKNPILVEFYNPENGDWNSHVSLGLWADMYLIAPATANTLSKMSTGVADNLLLTTYLSARCPVVVAPAMDLDMYRHAATQLSLSTLKERGVWVSEPESGELASGLEGKGRMAEPAEIVSYVKYVFGATGSMVGRKVLITAGPTREDIDPVRYITNHSSGKMAYAIAESLACRGAEVEIVSGPTAQRLSMPNITISNVISASDMYERVMKSYQENRPDITVLCAAVSDFTPSEKADKKIKREKDDMILSLKPTQDIAASVGKIKREGSLLVGFALETDNEFDNAQGKLERKNLDMIVLNSLQDPGAGFAVDTNKVSIIFRGGETLEYPLKSKSQVADDIVDNIEKLLECSGN